MAYQIKYLFRFESANHTTREIHVLKDGYTGDPIHRRLGRAPVLKKNDGGVIRGTSLEFYAECSVDQEFIEFYTSDPKEYRVDLYAGETLLWQGYITPELYSEPDIAPPYDVQVVATDGIGELKLYDFAPQGTVTLRAMLSYLLGHTGLSTGVYLISSLRAGSASAGALLGMTVNLDYMSGKTCYETLTYLLDTLHATITWWKGRWILARETNVTISSGKVQSYDTTGSAAALDDSVQVLGKIRTNPVWPVGQLSTKIDPAKNKVVVQAPWHPVTAFVNSEMDTDTGWAKTNNAVFDSTAKGYHLVGNGADPNLATIAQSINMTGLRAPMEFTARVSAKTGTDVSSVGFIVGVVVVYRSSNVNYYLRKTDNGSMEWTNTANASFLDFSICPVSVDTDEADAEEISFVIPPFFSGSSFPSGSLTVYIGGSRAMVFSAHLDVVLSKGYQDVLRIDNGARGEGNEVEIAFGRVTSDTAYYMAFLQGLLLNSGSLITAFSDANFSTAMDYLAFIARDYALSVALPRAVISGTTFLEDSVDLPPLVFTKGGLDYWLETFAWDLYEDELEISARTLPAAALTVSSEVVLESDGSTVSSASSGSGSGSGSSVVIGAGGGMNYFEVNEDLSSLVQPRDPYRFLSAKEGLFFAGFDASNPDPDLEVRVVGTGANARRVLYSPLPLITGGDQIVIDGTPGQGGGGGGAGYLYELGDVYHSGTDVLTAAGSVRGGGDLLGFDSTLGKWVAVPGSDLLASLAVATTSTKGLMSAADKTKLDGIATGATAVTEATVTGWGFTKNAGTVTSVTLTSGTGITVSNSGTAITGYGTRTISLNVAGAKTALGLGSMAYAATGDYVPATRTVNGKTLSSNITLTLDDVGNGSTRSLANYVLKAGDTMTGALIIENDATAATGQIKGGNIILSRGASSTANSSAGAITFYGRRSGSAYRNGARIAAVAGADAATYDRVDLVFYASNNTGSGATPAFAEAMRIKSSRAVSIASTLSVGGLATLSAGATIPSGQTLKIGLATLSWNTDGYLYLDKPLLTAGDQIVNSGTPGGGGGGGAGYLYELGDVLANTNRTAVMQYDGVNSAVSGNLFAYNGTKWYALKLGNNLSISSGTLAATDTVYTLPAATSSVRGGIKIGYTQSGKNYPVQLSSEKAYVNVPWTDTVYTHPTNGANTTIFAATGKVLSAITVNSLGHVTSVASKTLAAADIPTLSVSKISDLTSNYLSLATAQTVTAKHTFSSGLNLSTASSWTDSDRALYFGANGEDSNLRYYYTDASKGLTYNPYSGVLNVGSLVVRRTDVAAHLSFSRPNWNYIVAPASGSFAFAIGGAGSSYTSVVINDGGIRPAAAAGSTCGSTTNYWSEIYGTNLYLGAGTHNSAAGSIVFVDYLSAQRNGFKISSTHATSADRIHLDFFSSNNGTSPYEPNWKRVLRLSYGGHVYVGTSDSNSNLIVEGTITSSGDQTVNSDETLKTNLRNLRYTTKDIAACRAVTFDWKDGHGRSAGSIAQDWKRLVPELVHGEEGHMTLAYGQIALINTVIEAREIEKLKMRIDELERKLRIYERKQ